MKIKIILLCLLYSGLVSCGQNRANDDHDHSGHDHSHTEDHVHNHDSDHEHTADEHGAATEEAGHSHDELIELCPDRAREIGITTGKAETALFSAVIPATGEILPMQGDLVTVTAKNEGFVVFSTKNIVSGATVGSGERILVITGSGITQNNYDETVLQAKITLDKAREQYERISGLFQDRLSTQTELRNSEAEFRAAELRYNNLIRGFENGGLRVTSPISGFVTDYYVKEGDFVQLGQPLFTISKNRNVMLKAEVSPEYLTRLPYVESANFRTSASGPFHSIKELGGRVASYGRSVDPQSLLVPVYFSLPYRTEFAAGSYAEIRLVLTEGDSRIVVPNEAIVEDFGFYFVYTADEHGYERRDVRIGGTDGIRTEILSGIREDEEIVMTGAARLKLIERLGSLGAEAAHAGHSH